MSYRIKWLDFCKFFAMFLVTWDHAAQVISSQIFNNLLLGTLVAVHMPLFFIISGYFINLDKIRDIKPIPFVKSKFMHLMLPAIAWTGLYCLLTLTAKGFLTFCTFYWYLFSLFISFVILLVFCKLFRNNFIVILLSTAVVMVIPYTDIANLNFMYPFLMLGYLLKVYPPKKSSLWFLMSLVISICLLLIWNWDYSVYLSRFNTAYLTVDMVMKMLVRLAAGASISYVIIYLASRFENSKIVCKLCLLGQYTLVTYLAQLVIFGVLYKYVFIGINQPILLETLSLALCIFTYALCILLQKVISKNKLAKQILLGMS